MLNGNIMVTGLLFPVAADCTSCSHMTMIESGPLPLAQTGLMHIRTEWENVCGLMHVPTEWVNVSLHTFFSLKGMM